MTQGFRAKLATRQEKINSLVCVGLDPKIENIPPRIKKQYLSEADSVEHWMIEIMDTTAQYASMWKPQRV